MSTKTPAVRLSHGVFASATPRFEGPFETMEAWAPALPRSAVFTGLSAAHIYELWLPPLPQPMPLFVAMGGARGEVRPARPELRVSEHPTRPAQVFVGAVPLATVPELLIASARVLGLLDLTVLVDAALHLQRVSRAELVLVSQRRRRGAPLLRDAIALADARSESPWETVLRLFHVAVGVPVTPQMELRDEGGAFVARADLVITGTRTLHEYDGGAHREPDVQREDLRRDRRLIASGHIRRGYTADDLRNHPAAILADCDATLGRRPDSARLDAWRVLTTDSLFFGGTTPRLRAVLKPRSARKLLSYGGDSGD